ncbi:MULTISPECIES: M50 family metallopeptidase [unclassified Colwellia]|uniref:M50 family metallopeptidase n=1 Tax=unclassified Colwellia TaxID=196834 RepID=UPI0015F4D6AC|nr:MULTISPECIES: M50 family metallopeptidase [unclassified Colwellia]MBA6233021.1 M50 family metallopeptidase [Colwellia sp. MB02u-7]MBA6236699.1 M50 family metallopeptidase [Colwellia sp. MB02u-11]MBA6255891.1 M50 family metallopeptidase [Colwellia sp. MB3u-28]MBA6262033.1 M50 family metallopeptidase [Colwellia sp. MB3u-41]MBA6299001.1 M50 family metallopeptidase [Colwellia sp. MB3u-22]
MNTQSLPFSTKYRFWLILCAALILSQIPIISIPFKWLESYFHEISHGLAALFTGGSIVQIQLFSNGAGLCTTRGGMSFLISFMGYAGAALWGMGIYYIATMHQRIAQILSGIIALLLLTTLVFWARDLLTLLIITALLALVVLKFKYSKLSYLQISLQITGALILLNSVKSPWYLIDGRNIGDGAALSQLTGIPEFLWVIVWFSIGVGGIVWLARTSKKR